VTDASKILVRDRRSILEEKLLGGNYRLLEEIGKGGFGAVYKATKIDSEGSGAVAIKLLNKNSSQKVEEYLRFQKEAVMMCQFAHPGVVSVYELGEDAGSYFIVMEYIKGANLRAYVTNRAGGLQLIEVLDILCQAAEALDYVHSFKIIHRDVKPQNILICESTKDNESKIQVKLVDFGVARIASQNDRRNVVGEVVGTYAYMSPESTGLIPVAATAASDVYSFGIVAFELLSGKVPFSEATNELTMRAHVDKKAPSLAEIRGSPFPSILESFVAKCLGKLPADRYQSFFAISSDLRRLIATLKRQLPLVDFELGVKDLGVQEKISELFVGRQTVLQNIFEFVRSGVEPLRKRLSWGVLCGGVGVGKSKILEKAINVLMTSDISTLAVRFTASEKRLAFQSLIVSVEESLQSWAATKSEEYRSFLAVLTTADPVHIVALSCLFPSLQPFASRVSQGTELKKDLERVLKVVEPEQLRDLSNHETDLLVTLYFGFADFMKAFSAIRGHTVLIFDDVHLADAHSLRLFTFMAQQFNSTVSFSMLLSLRPSGPLSHLLNDLRSLKRRVRFWEVEEFSAQEVHEYLVGIGLPEVEPDFLERFYLLTNGVPLQVNRLARRLMSEDILYFRRDESRCLALDKYEWDRFENKDQSVEVLVASLNILDETAKNLMSILAVAGEPYLFEMIKIEGFKEGKILEESLRRLVKQGYVSASGEKMLTWSRLHFSIVHEKIRKEVLTNSDPKYLKWIHLMLAEHLELLYRGAKKDVVLKIGRHYDCAGELANPEAAAESFVRAVRIFVRDHDTLSARHFINRTVLVSKNIVDVSMRNRRLREVYEAEYSIFASMGQFVRASEVCQQLIALTEDLEKRNVLKVFWGQLLMGIGQHRLGHSQITEVLAQMGVLDREPKREMAEKVFHALQFGKKFEVFNAPFGQILQKNPLGTLEAQALTLKVLAEMHGVESDPHDTIVVALRHGLTSKIDSKWSAVFKCVESIYRLSIGQIKEALGLFEDSLRYLQENGHNDSVRLVQVLRSIWIDYPMGRMDKVLNLYDPKNAQQLPPSGLLHFESAGLRSWLALVAPSSEVAIAVKRSEGRRKSDKGDKAAWERDLSLKQDRLAVRSLAKGHGARRILDASENLQFTSLALFSDAFRQGLGSKIEPLQKAVGQFDRQRNSSRLGVVFHKLTLCILDLHMGRFNTALQSFDLASEALLTSSTRLLSAPVCDAYRLAFASLPLLAVGLGARGWPWGEKLLKRLEVVNQKLKMWEGDLAPRRSCVTSFYKGISEYMNGERRSSFDFLGQALEESRAQRCELIELFCTLALGTFCGQLKEKRAQEHLDAAWSMAHKWKWDHLERVVKGVAERLKVTLSKPVALGALPPKPRLLPLESPQLGSLFTKMESFKEESNVFELRMEMSKLALEIASAEYCFFASKNSQDSLKSVELMLAFDKYSNPIDLLKKQKSFKSSFAMYLEKTEKSAIVLPFDLSEFTETASLPKRFEDYASASPDFQSMTNVHVPHAYGSVALSMAPAFHVQTQSKTIALHQVVESDVETKISDSEDATVQRNTMQNSITLKPVESAVQSARSKAQSKDFICIVPILYGAQTLGWFILPGVSHTNLKEKDIPAELSILGWHAGHLLGAFSKMNPGYIPPVPLVGNGRMPLKLTVEKLQGELDSPSKRSVVAREGVIEDASWFGLQEKGMVLFHWQLNCQDLEKGQQFAHLLSRHLEFLIRSLDARKDGPFNDQFLRVSDRIVSELAMLTQVFEANLILFEFNFQLVLLDCVGAKISEIRLGKPSIVSTGAEAVFEEKFQDLGRSLAGDKWVVVLRNSQILGSVAWLLCLNEAAGHLAAQFTREHFLETARAMKEKSASPLADALKIEAFDSAPEGVCFLFDGVDPDDA
jgi:serine/threonine protein kinase